MASIKRKMKRQQKKTDPDFYVVAGCQDGDLFVIVYAGCRISGTTVFNAGLPDGDLPWLAQKIVARIEQSPCRDQEDALCIADQVIQNEKLSLLALSNSKGFDERTVT